MRLLKELLIALAIGAALATAIVWPLKHVTEARQCKDLSTEVDVWSKCTPQNGCVASYTETLQLVKRIHRCQEAIGASKDSSPDSQ